MLEKQDPVKSIHRRLITAKTTLKISMLVVGLTVLTVWLMGLEQHRTIFINSILSISILSLSFFLFLTIGLYNGVKLKDDLGKISDNIEIGQAPDLSSGLDVFSEGASEQPFEVDGLEGIVAVILGIIFWIVISGLLLLFVWFFGAMLWASILVFMAMLYWIFFRALRLVFKNSNKCKGNLKTSMVYGLMYTLCYNFWMYVIIFISHYL